MVRNHAASVPRCEIGDPVRSQVFLVANIRAFLRNPNIRAATEEYDDRSDPVGCSHHEVPDASDLVLFFKPDYHGLICDSANAKRKKCEEDFENTEVAG